MAHDTDVDIDPHGCEALVKAGRAKVLRQSTLGTADTCLKRLEYDLDPSIPYGSGEGRAAGTSYHAGEEAYYRTRQENGFYVPNKGDMEMILGIATDAFDIEVERGGKEFRWESDRDKALGRVYTMLNAYFEGEHYWPKEYNVWGVETTFMMPLLPGWVVKGTTDLILEDPNNWLVVVDHKSAKKPWKKGKEGHRSTNQPPWYVHWLRQITGREEIVFAFDIMTHDGKFERRSAPVEQAYIDGVLKKAAIVTELIEQGGPYPPNVSSFLCDARWCDHHKYCPFGAPFDDPVPVEITSTTEMQEAPF